MSTFYCLGLWILAKLKKVFVLQNNISKVLVGILIEICSKKGHLKWIADRGYISGRFKYQFTTYYKEYNII